MNNSIRLTLVLTGIVLTGTVSARPGPVRDPYALCGSGPSLPAAPQLDGDVQLPGSTVVWADDAQAVDDGISRLRGNVELRRDDQAVRADTVTWDKPRDIVNVTGHVHFWDPELFWSGERGYMYLGDDKAYLENGEYRLLGRRGNGFVAYATSDRSEHESYLEKADFSTCEKSDRAWALAASKMKLHHAEERGEAKHVVLRFHDIPIFYWPYLTFPLNNQRKSGFLMPLLGYRNRTGTDITVPFYWNIAPNQDATLSVRALSERGIMFGAQYRYLLRNGLGQIDAHYLPEDDRRNGNARHLVSFKHDQALMNGRMHANLVFNDVSDRRYFEDFGTSLTSTSTRLLERRADLTYGGPLFQRGNWGVLGRVQSYQTVDAITPGYSLAYDRLPQVSFSALVPNLFSNLYAQVNADATYFDRSVGPTGSRFDVSTAFGFPIRRRAGFIEPRVSLRHTSYILDTSNLFEKSVDVRDDGPSRTLPSVSVDSGLFFERNISFGGNSYVQTLEPRAFYLYVPYRDQFDLPLFDTGLYDISFAGLFRENRFNGPDRIGDANQFTAALTTRLISDNSGWERLRLSMGQTFYLDDRDVALRSRLQPELDPRLQNLRAVDPTAPMSETLAELGARFTREWSARANITWNSNNGDIRKATAGVRYWGDNGLIFNAEYRLRRDILGFVQPSFRRFGFGPTNIEQADVSARVPVSPNFAVLGRWLYALDEQNTTEAMGGIEYDSCCWSMRFVARHYLTAAPFDNRRRGQMDTGFFLQIEFKGLAGAGKNTLNFLRNSIPGYRDYW